MESTAVHTLDVPGPKSTSESTPAKVDAAITKMSGVEDLMGAETEQLQSTTGKLRRHYIHLGCGYRQDR